MEEGRGPHGMNTPGDRSAAPSPGDRDTTTHPSLRTGTRPVYPGAPLDMDADPSARARRDAERCHILPAKKGVRVMTQGVFDIIHLGHLHYFQAAKALGDELVVVLARDETVAKNKHAPIFSEEARRELVAALDPVDYALLGHRGDFYRIVVETEPDIICIGYDQPYKEAAIEEECARRGLEVRVVRLEHMDYDLDSTRKVVEAIAAKLARHELYTAEPAKEQKKLEEVGAIEGEAPEHEAAPGAGHAAKKVNRPVATDADDEEADEAPDGKSSEADTDDAATATARKGGRA